MVTVTMYRRQIYTWCLIQLLFLFSIQAFRSLVLTSFNKYKPLSTRLGMNGIEFAPSTPKGITGKNKEIIVTENEKKSPKENLCLPYQVFLEDTDMYGMVFNSNYIKFMRRGFETCWPMSRIVGIDRMRFRAPAVLGDQIVVKGELESVGNATSTWNFEIVDSNSSKKFCTAVVTGLFFDEKGQGHPLPQQSHQEKIISRTKDVAFALEPSTADHYGRHSTHQCIVSPWEDEFDGRGNLQPSSILNYMERLRTLTLGDPKEGGLTRLYEEGRSVVVSKLDNFRYNYKVQLGDQLTVKTSYEIKRRAVLAKQSVWNRDSLVAHADVELLCIDSVSKSFKSFPTWCQKEMLKELS